MPIRHLITSLKYTAAWTYAYDDIGNIASKTKMSLIRARHSPPFQGGARGGFIKIDQCVGAINLIARMN